MLKVTGNVGHGHTTRDPSSVGQKDYLRVEEGHLCMIYKS